MTTIRHERPVDAPAREALLDLAFGPCRFDKTSQRLRDGQRRRGPRARSGAARRRCALLCAIRLFRRQDRRPVAARSLRGAAAARARASTGSARRRARSDPERTHAEQPAWAYAASRAGHGVSRSLAARGLISRRICRSPRARAFPPLPLGGRRVGKSYRVTAFAIHPSC